MPAIKEFFVDISNTFDDVNGTVSRDTPNSMWTSYTQISNLYDVVNGKNVYFPRIINPDGGLRGSTPDDPLSWSGFMASLRFFKVHKDWFKTDPDDEAIQVVVYRLKGMRQIDPGDFLVSYRNSTIGKYGNSYEIPIGYSLNSKHSDVKKPSPTMGSISLSDPNPLDTIHTVVITNWDYDGKNKPFGLRSAGIDSIRFSVCNRKLYFMNGIVGMPRVAAGVVFDVPYVSNDGLTGGKNTTNRLKSYFIDYVYGKQIPDNVYYGSYGNVANEEIILDNVQITNQNFCVVSPKTKIINSSIISVDNFRTILTSKKIAPSLHIDGCIIVDGYVEGSYGLYSDKKNPYFLPMTNIKTNGNIRITNSVYSHPVFRTQDLSNVKYSNISFGFPAHTIYHGVVELPYKFFDPTNYPGDFAIPTTSGLLPISAYSVSGYTPEEYRSQYPHHYKNYIFSGISLDPYTNNGYDGIPFVNEYGNVNYYYTTNHVTTRRVSDHEIIHDVWFDSTMRDGPGALYFPKMELLFSACDFGLSATKSSAPQNNPTSACVYTDTYRNSIFGIDNFLYTNLTGSLSGMSVSAIYYKLVNIDDDFKHELYETSATSAAPKYISTIGPNIRPGIYNTEIHAISPNGWYESVLDYKASTKIKFFNYLDAQASHSFSIVDKYYEPVTTVDSGVDYYLSAVNNSFIYLYRYPLSASINTKLLYPLVKGVSTYYGSPFGDESYELDDKRIGNFKNFGKIVVSGSPEETEPVFDNSTLIPFNIKNPVGFSEPYVVVYNTDKSFKSTPISSITSAVYTRDVRRFVDLELSASYFDKLSGFIADFNTSSTDILSSAAFNQSFCDVFFTGDTVNSVYSAKVKTNYDADTYYKLFTEIEHESIYTKTNCLRPDDYTFEIVFTRKNSCSMYLSIISDSVSHTSYVSSANSINVSWDYNHDSFGVDIHGAEYPDYRYLNTIKDLRCSESLHTAAIKIDRNGRVVIVYVDLYDGQGYVEIARDEDCSYDVFETPFVNVGHHNNGIAKIVAQKNGRIYSSVGLVSDTSSYNSAYASSMSKPSWIYKGQTIQNPYTFDDLIGIMASDNQIVSLNSCRFYMKGAIFTTKSIVQDVSLKDRHFRFYPWNLSRFGPWCIGFGKQSNYKNSFYYPTADFGGHSLYSGIIYNSSGNTSNFIFSEMYNCYISWYGYDKIKMWKNNNLIKYSRSGYSKSGLTTNPFVIDTSVVVGSTIIGMK